MTVHVDLSASQLDPDIVLRFIFDHKAKGPKQNMLFTISKRTFQKYRSTLDTKDWVKVTKKEADKINALTGKKGQPGDYLMSNNISCRHCDRVLTFFDMFMGGRDIHGPERIKEILTSRKPHLQLGATGQVVELRCTGCGQITSNVINGDPRPYHYHDLSGGYCYA